MTKRFSHMYIFALASLLLATFTYADVIAVQNDQSYYGYYSKGQGNTYTLETGSGILSERSQNTDTNAYFIFDLSNLSGTILSATIDLSGGTFTGNPNLELVQVSTDVSLLGVDDPNLFQSIHQDLSKTSYVDSSSNGIYTLNAKALTDINNATGLFAIGLNNKTKNSSWFSDLSTALTLTTATPEASEIIMLALVIGLIFWFYGHQKKPELSNS